MFPASRVAGAIALLAGVIAVGYAHTLRFPFHFDDFDWIRDNLALRPPLDLGAIWAFRPSRFVADLSFSLNLLSTGPSLVALHLTNLAIHGLASLLAGWIAFDLSRSMPAGPSARGTATGSPAAVGLVAALLFAAHPLATQSVTYLVQRITSLAAVWMLGATAAFLRARRDEGGGWWPVAWALALLAAFTKEMAVALPLALAVLEWQLRAARVPGRAPALRLAPFLLVLPLVVWGAQQPLGPEQRVYGGLRETDDIGRAAYALTQLTVIPRYLALAIWPAGQSVDPAPALHTRVDGPVIAGAALLLAIGVAAFAVRRRAPLATIGWTWFIATLLPESSVIPIRDLMNEQRAYLPLAGLSWAAASSLTRVRDRRWRTGATIALVIALALATHARNRVWRDELSLWSDAAARSPANARAQNNLGLALEAAGRIADAERAYHAAIASAPRPLYALTNLGRLYGEQHRLDEAWGVLSTAERLAPSDPLVLNNLGTVWWMRGDTARAADCYTRALAADPGARYPAGNLSRLRAGNPPP